MKKIRKEYYHDLMNERLLVCDKDGELLDVWEEVASGGRVRLLYNCYFKMAINTIHRLTLSHGEIVFALRLLDNMKMTNSLSFEEVEEEFHPVYIRRVKSSLKKAGVIDKLRLASTPRWYFNPHLAMKSKTVDKRLSEHFKGRLKYK